MKFSLILLSLGIVATVACNDSANQNAGSVTDTSGAEPAVTTDNTRNADTSVAVNRPDTANSASAEPLDNSSITFVKKALSGGQMEVELGNYAVNNATSQRVKDFGAMMVKDHSAANEKLQSLMTTHRMELPQKMESAHQKHVDHLSKQKGAAFDKAYMNMMVKDHKEDIAAFEKAAKGKNTTVQNFATATLPTLKTHLDSAQAIAKGIK